MDPYELRPTPTSVPAADEPTVISERNLTQATDSATSPPAPQRTARAGEAEALLRALATLQRQQSEQTHLLRQLLAEIELLKAAQAKQGGTVTKLDRRMRWARFWRLSWLLLRIAVFGGVVWFLIYLIGVEQIQAMWERLVWLFT